MTTGCYGCGIDLDQPFIVFLPGQRRPRIMVYVRTSRSSFAFCDLCFEERRFRDLSQEDIEAITCSIGQAYVEDQPIDAIRLLEPFLAIYRVPDILSPLGRAFIGVGRVEEGRALLREALALSPRHPYVAIDRPFLEDA